MAFEKLVQRDVEVLGFVSSQNIFKITTADETVQIDGQTAKSSWKEAIACLMK